MSKEDIAIVLDETKLRLFVGVQVAAQIWHLDVEDMGEEAYAAAVVDLTRPAPARGRCAGGVAAGACGWAWPARGPCVRPSRPLLTHALFHTRIHHALARANEYRI